MITATAVQNDYSAIPQEMVDRPNWVCWKRKKKSDGKLTKVPYNPKTGDTAKANDPTTWSTHAEAVAAAANPKNHYDGIGFEFLGTPYCCIDFDSVIAEDGSIDPFAVRILELLGNPYAEISPSGDGIHTFIKCSQLPDDGRKFSKGHTGVEIYSGDEGGRYFTMTGIKAGGEGIPTITPEQVAVPYFLMSQCRNEKLQYLWLGDTSHNGGDDSSADQALANELVRQLGADRAKIDQFFRASGLMRDKWDEKHGRDTYGNITIDSAIKYEAKYATKNAVKDAEPEKPKKVLVFASEAVPNTSDYDYAIEHLGAITDRDFEGWFPLGNVSLIGGSSGGGKTTFMLTTLVRQHLRLEVFGHITTSRPYLVLMFDRGKSDFNRTMRALGYTETAAQMPVKFLSPVRDFEAAAEIAKHLEETTPRPQILFIEGLDMLVSDPNAMKVVQPFLSYLQEIAEHYHVAIIGSMGAPKSKAGEGYTAKRDTMFGSAVWARLSATVLAMQYPEGDDTAARRELTVMFRHKGAEKIVLEFVNGSLEQVHEDPAGGEEPTISPEMQHAIHFLRKILQDGPRLIADVKKMAEDNASTRISAKSLLNARLHLQERGELKGSTKKPYTWELIPVHATTSDLIQAGDEKQAVLETASECP